jgi:hypothetical protein
VVVDLGEADVLVGKQAQLFNCSFDAGRARRDGIEKVAELLLVDGAASFSDVAAL